MDGEGLTAAIGRAQQGDSAAAQWIVDQFAGRIFGFFYRTTGSRTDAEDLMQDVFVRFVRMIGAYRHDGRFEAWLFRIAANLGRDRARKAKRSPKWLVSSATQSAGENGFHVAPMEDLVGVAEPADARMTLAEDIDALNAALAQLPPAEREVIMLRHFSQMSFKEIAEACELPLGTALARSHRGLQRLRELMSDSSRMDRRVAARPVVRG
jgi:RNA polymerase sigma-70 factor (ECF subfamily)